MLHDDDPMAIERMLLFCYTDDYDDSGTESRKPLKEQALEAGKRCFHFQNANTQLTIR